MRKSKIKSRLTPAQPKPVVHIRGNASGYQAWINMPPGNTALGVSQRHIINYIKKG